MKPFDTSGMLENDEELESVLREYFQQEMPPELLELSDISDAEYEKRFRQIHTSGNGVPDTFHRKPGRQYKTGLLMLGLCVCLIIGISFTQFQPADQIPVAKHTITQPESVQPAVKNEVSRNSHILEPASLAVVDQGDTSIEMTPQIDKRVHESIDITLYNTELGPIEQRTELSWTNITVQNPNTGTNVEMSMPELTIDFVPVSNARLSLINDENGNDN
tara:strand:- start:28809 stop:29465 length:657 start_codon:yes stop_codon:yes gene_type:complete